MPNKPIGNIDKLESLLRGVSNMRRNKLENDQYVYYSDLPIGKEKPFFCEGNINGENCVIFLHDETGAILDFLMENYPEMECFQPVRDYSPSIISCFSEHDRVFYFIAQRRGAKYKFVAIKLGPLWESTSDDFHRLINLINYSEDYAESDGNVFMDDYGLC